MGGLTGGGGGGSNAKLTLNSVVFKSQHKGTTNTFTIEVRFHVSKLYISMDVQNNLFFLVQISIKFSICSLLVLSEKNLVKGFHRKTVNCTTLRKSTEGVAEAKAYPFGVKDQ